MLSENPTERRVQLAGIVLILGLVVEALSLLRRGPVAFMIFIGIGGLLLVLGISLFLLALLKKHHERG